ncbi:hypothetical protein SAMN04488580_101349 [Mycobacterium sp. 283mftsu]|nr:hypothetical protein SAMN04488580_101349 [Mycobacterium sp. 283mftsu]
MYGWTCRWKQVIGPTVSVAAVLAIAGAVVVPVTQISGAPGGFESMVAEPPGCWGPHGVDPDCLGPGPYGHGEWGPGSGTVASGATPVPGDPSPGPAESDPTVP